MSPRSLLPALALMLLGSVVACERGPRAPESRPDAGPTEGLLARVNGVPITKADVQREARGGGHANTGIEDEKDTLDRLVRQELAAQRAEELKLDPGPEYRAEAARIEAMLQALKRRKLAEAYDRHVAETATVSDEEARKYFEAEGRRIRTEVHVWQIMLHDRAKIDEARRAVEAGVPFEEVARRSFPKLPESAGPFWDVGYLRWTQVPPQWRSALEGLEVGQTSGVIEGPKSRHWIVKLVDRRENPEITFDTAKPMIVETLRAERLETLRAEAERELRSKARVVYAEGAATAK